MTGVFEFTIGDKQRGLKFGMYGLKLACEFEQCTLDQLLFRIGNGGGAGVSAGTLLNIFFGAATHYAKSKKQEIDFNDMDVSDWIDEIGLQKSMEYLKEGFSQFVPKNLSPLEYRGTQAIQ